MTRMNWSPRAVARSIDRPKSRRLTRRLVQLYADLVLAGWVFYAPAIGPLAQVLMRRLSVRLHRSSRSVR